MPTFEITTPEGTFEVTAPDEQSALNAVQGQSSPAPKAQDRWFPSFAAATEGSAAGLMGGYDDEIGAAMLAPVEAGIDWFKGDGFDMGRAYTRKQQQLDALKAERRENHPVASIAGEVAGGLALGGGMGKAGLSLAARPVSTAGKIGAGAAEGAGYGALYGSGEAKPGERLEGAATGAAIGGVTGGAVGAVGGALANRAARKMAPAAAPAADDIATASQALYTASEKQGVAFTPKATTHLKNNIKVAAGQLNEKLRPLTAGTVDDAEKMLSGQMSLKQIDEFRQGLLLDIKAAKGQDKVYLERMKGIVDNFLDNAGPGDMTGGPQGVEMLKSARHLWSRYKKTELVEKLIDMAEVKGAGQYTQSGFANAIKNEMKALYKQIQSGKSTGWTKEEIALIRQMASGGSQSKTVNLLAKFAPRGAVSIALGQVIGSLAPGAGNIAVPIAGHLAGEAADRASMAAAQTLRSGAATGQGPAAIPRLPNRGFPFIPGTSAASMGTAPSLVPSR